jgi:hypothetical protein
MIRKLTTLSVVLAMFCLSCNSSSDSTANSEALQRNISQLERNIDSGNGDQTSDSVGLPQQTKTDKTKQDDVPPKPVDWDKKIVKTASLNSEIKDYKSFSQQLGERVKKFGGYISQEQQSQSEYKIENVVTIKVPVDQFESLINELTQASDKLNEKKISSEDVTTQLVDGKSRLEAKKQVRLRYLDLLKQAKNMEEILTVQKEINDIQEDIEAVNGRINFLGHSSAMSTIELTYFQILNPSAKSIAETDAGFLTKVKTAFANGWYWIGEVFVALLSIWPLLGATFLTIAVLRKRKMIKLK